VHINMSQTRTGQDRIGQGMLLYSGFGMSNIPLYLPMSMPMSFDPTDTGIVRLHGVECFHRAMCRVLCDAISVHRTSTTNLTSGMICDVR